MIGNNVKIYPQAFIGNNVRVGDHSVVHPGVKIYHDCVIGSHVTIHAGSVIGSDGFGFAPQSDGTFKKVPQIGNVLVEDYVEIGANATIDRATIGSSGAHACVGQAKLLSSDAAHPGEPRRDTHQKKATQQRA